MEQIYTIPVNEAFEASRDDTTCGCPVCSLYRKLEDNELDLILGASMMEPDVRIKTNEQGFCKTHYDMMFKKKNRLGLALMLESHIDEFLGDIKPALIGAPGAKTLKRLDKAEDDCYICKRIDFNFEHMIETIVYLWDGDPEFPAKFKAQPYFCLPHYRLLLKYGLHILPKKKQKDFVDDCREIVEPYMAKLKDDVSWFCKKFDYRYDEEPWYDSKDAVERALKFLRSDIHVDAPKK